ncbi:polyketide synthase [Diplodia corticola]|uniref:Polyketide synthase n=1 Tax=Diplodia corticola TaxID=236234 RepID=A0A1J9S1C2_9PEZI|nr:polyketide synthase [Diplodia corticola]OJD33820.1 polyketide synthase [Diplodia corticola]
MDIAIIGIGARLPGDASTPEGFWNLLMNARSARSEAPKSRYNAEAFYHPDPDRAGSTPVTTGHFLNQDPGVFDAPFFSITPAEAKAMDPQQRLLLEVSYEALENAGLRISDLKGSKTSCYAGSFTGDYRDLTMHDNQGHGLYTATGTHTSLVANRVSWFFDLAGPSVTMDTACSASLTAFHLACQGIRNGEADMATQGLVAGTHLILGPDSTLLLSAGRILSPEGASKAFDARADGYGRGEGVGVVVVKPLAAALRDGDTVRAVVRGSAANHNGRTPSPSQPSARAQAALTRAAYARAGLPPSSCGFVEAHGTGTAVGDPLEMRALAETVGEGRTTDLYVGSAKTNIGHLEGAAGLAGLIKCVLVVEKGIVPPNVGFEKLNPRIVLPDHVKIATAAVPWPTTGPRIASVNSFGFGGANAHVIIEDAYHFLHERGLSGIHQTVIHPALPPGAVNGHTNGHTNGVNGHTNDSTEATPRPRLLVLSAQDKQGTQRLSSALSSYLSSTAPHPSLLPSLAHTLSRHRTPLLWKTFLLAPTPAAAQTALASPLRPPTRSPSSSTGPRLALIFTGQGAQWPTMGAALFAHSATFRASMAASQRTLASLGCPWDIRTELLRGPPSASRVADAALSQPLCVALQAALVDVLREELGVGVGVGVGVAAVAAVAGHSSGEMGAAYAAGLLSRRAAVALAWARGVCAARVEAARDVDGAMLAVRAGGAEVAGWLEEARGLSGAAVVACFNSPRNCTVSGDRKALEGLRAELERRGVGSTVLGVGVAYHSWHMRRIADEYREAVVAALAAEDGPGGKTAAAGGAGTGAGTVPFFSSVTGKLLRPEELGPEYWVENLVSPVNFTGAVQSMIRSTRDGADGAAFVDAFVEVGPHSALRTYLMEICAGESVPVSIPYSTMLRRNTDAVESLLTAAGELWCLGADVDVDRVNGTESGARMLTDLPPYPFNHSSSYWAESAITRQYRFRQQPRTDHLGVPFAGSVTPQWRNFLKLRENPWLGHFKIKSEIVYPNAGLVVMAIEAIKQLADASEHISAYELRDLAFGDPLRIVDGEGGAEVATQVSPPTSKGSWADFSIVSRSDSGDWTPPHCHGKVRVIYASQQLTEAAQTERRWEQKELAALYNSAVTDCGRPEPDFYATLEAASYEYGAAFRNLERLYLGDKAGRAVARVPDTKSLMPHHFEYPTVIHPAALDAFVQMIYPALTESGCPLITSTTATPVGLERLYLSADVAFKAGAEFDVFSKGERTSSGTRQVCVYGLQSTSPAPAVVIEGLRVVSGPTEAVHGPPTLCFDTVWREDVDLLSQEQVAAAVFARAEPDPFDGAHYAMLDLVALPYLQDAIDWLATNEGRLDGRDGGFLKLFAEWMADKLRENAAVVAGPKALREQAAKAVVELQNTEAGAVTVELIHRVGENLKGILSGDVEPLQVMLQNGLLYEYYRVGLGTSFNSNVAAYMGMLAHKGAGQLSVLEIGGGTGGTTRRILDAIRNPDGTSGVSRYVFTDVSPGFLGNAATNFERDASVMEFKTLDIEEDPAAQGFEPGTFDVLVCANVLHATKRIRDTLARCRKLLKKDGKLVLAELTDNPVFMGLMMGPLPGWWLGEEDGRHGGPIMTAAKWDGALKDSGFTGVEVHIRGDKDARDGSPTALIVSTRKDEQCTAARDKKPGFCVLVDDSAGAKSLASALEQLLVARGERVSILTWPGSGVSASSVRDSYCICLVGLRPAIPFNVPAGTLAELKHLLVGAAAVCWVRQDTSSSAQHHPPNTVLSEDAASNIITVDLDPTTASPAADASSLHRLIDLLASRHSTTLATTPQQDTSYAIRNGFVQIPRLAAATALNDAVALASSRQSPDTTIQLSQTTDALKLAIKTPGQLDSLSFVHDDGPAFASPLPPGWIEIAVHAAGVNARDAATALSGGGATTSLALGCSGIVTRVNSSSNGTTTITGTAIQPGDRVVCFAAASESGGLSTRARLPAYLASPLPAAVGLDDAAGWAVPHAVAHHALVRVARLRPGETVLVHAAAGGVGQAAVALARGLGADVFVTAGSDAKRGVLVDACGVRADRVFGSRGDRAFARAVERATGGRGVDVVLNSLGGESRRLSWGCLAEFGRFLDIGDWDGLDVLPSLKNRSYFRIDLYELVKKESKVSKSIMDSVSKALDTGNVRTAKPLSVYGAGKIETVFRYMQTGEHMGQTVISMVTDDQVKYTPSPPRITLRQDATYILAGEFAGAGRELARWLISRGAHHLVFLSESAASHRANEAHVQTLKDNHGIEAAAILADNKTSLDAAVQSIQSSPLPAKGVIIGDMMPESQQPDSTSAAYHELHTALGAAAAPADFTVLLSSGPEAAAAAASFPNNARSSTQQSHRTLSLTLGLGTKSSLRAPPLRDVEAAIEAALLHLPDDSSSHNTSSAAFGPITLVSPPLSNDDDDDPSAAHLRSPRYGPLRQAHHRLGTTTTTSSTTPAPNATPNASSSLHAELTQLPPAGATASNDDDNSNANAIAALVTHHLRARMARLMMVPADEVDAQRPLGAYGVDSLVAAELRNWLAAETGVDVGVARLTAADVPLGAVAWDVARERAGAGGK